MPPPGPHMGGPMGGMGGHGAMGGMPPHFDPHGHGMGMGMGGPHGGFPGKIAYFIPILNT